MNREELVARFAGRACKKLPKDSSLKEQKEVHRIKMEMKDYIRSNYPVRPTQHSLANISRNHTNYGETMQENFKRMVEKSS